MPERLTTRRPRQRKAKKQPPRSTKQVARVPRPPTFRQSAPHALVQQICSQYDAFCPSARGAKIPDNSSMSTLAFQYRTRYSMPAADATGRAGLLVVLQNNFKPFSPMSAFASNVGTIGVAAASTTLTGVKDYRIVSAGLRIRNIYPPLNTSGMVHIRIPQLGKDGFDAATTTFNITDYAVSQAYDTALRDVHELVIAIPRNGLPPVDYYSTDDDNTNPTITSPHGYQPVSIGVTGAPNGAVMLDVEIIVNYEYIFESGDAQNAIATASPPSNPIVDHAVAAVTSSATNIFAGGVSALASYAERKAMAYLGRATMPALAMLTM